MSEQTPNDHVEPDSLKVAIPKADVLLSNRLYNWFKKSSLYILPALGAAYYGLAQIWGFPRADDVVGTVVVLETLLGVVLGVSKRQYDNSESKYDGVITTVTDFEEGTTELGVSLNPLSVENKDTMLVKVKRK